MADAPISSIVSISISRETQAVTQAGFGIPLILTDDDDFGGSEFVRSYSDLDEVLVDFGSSSDTYLAAAAIFSQSPQVEQIKIGVESARVAQVVTIVFSGAIITGNTISAFTITSGGKVENVTATPFNTSNAQTLTDLATKIQALDSITTAASNGTDTITVTAAISGVTFSVSAITISGGASQATETTNTTVENSGPAESLAIISEEDDDWYGLIWTERDENLVYECAAYIETKRKIYITCSADADIISDADSDDIASTLSGANYDRTAVIYNDPESDYADAAWIGKVFPTDPGEATWKFKTLTSITSDDLTTDEREAAQGKNSNLYVTTGGLDITTEGVMASGEFIDVIRDTDWLQARLEERVFSRLANLPKIPFTNAGIAIIENEIRAVLQNAISEGILSGDPIDPDSDDEERSSQAYIISVPRASDVSSTDKANRLLPDIEFEAILAGAIHRVTVQGTVTV